MNGPLDLDTARLLARELGGARIPRSIPVALERAEGCVLAVDVRAAAHVPPADVSAVDGWAVAGPCPWQRVTGAASVAPGQAVAVSVGQPVPRGTEAVVRTEHARVDGAGGVTAPPPTPGSGVRPRGEELRAGELAMTRGASLTGFRLGLAAAAGADSVHVVLAPRTVLLVTGDELTDTGAARPGRTRDSLSHVLPPMLRALGADLERTARAGDDVEMLRDVFAGPYRSTVDLVITTGGTGTGADDSVRRALREVGARTVVAGTAVRPGGPAVLATVPDGPVVVTLPGDPLAAVAALVTLVRPLLDGWLGRPATPLEPVGLQRGGLLPSGLLPSGSGQGRSQVTDLVLARLSAGAATAVPTSHAGPGMLRGLVDADGFVVLDPDGSCRWLPLP